MAHFTTSEAVDLQVFSDAAAVFSGRARSRLQFEFAARQSEIVMLEWEWVNFAERRVEWPDSKTGGMKKLMSDEALKLLSAAHEIRRSRYVCPSIFDPESPMSWSTYYHAWRRFLKRAGVQHRGTHASRHRAITEIANSGVPVKDGMAMTGHKTVAQFFKYVHPDEKRIRKSVEKVSAQRRKLVGDIKFAIPEQQTIANPTTSTAQGNYRPYRRRKGANRRAPAGSRSAEGERAQCELEDLAVTEGA